ncbi:hypothetical protein WJX72_002655 [[Myrmecia] bisecta]|uniref:UTP-monosaccharide-1-phosphate uridylyltransferase n=1 Tax=[Myrmecia] bisecta TaxID=41462 RepID=A0AAW1R5G4_9CHLO
MFSPEQLKVLQGNEASFSQEDARLVNALLDLGQEHLFTHWPAPGQHDDDKVRQVAQLRHLDFNYNGGLVGYIQNAQRLLEDSRAGRNPFEGYTPVVPDGEKLDYGSESFQEYEELGAEAAGRAAFVLVAGGLGERLGYSGIKLALPAESATGTCFLQLYVESILALQARAQQQRPGTRLPLAIMTSGDTHKRTIKLLEDNHHFGMDPAQVHLIKQEKVACLSDNNAHLALDGKDPFTVQTKPHGHGDVHALLHSSGLVKRWQEEGLLWVCFFQDTNGLVFRALPAALGVSSRKDYDVNSLAVPRKAKEAIGGIAQLQHTSGRSMTINVEYNQLDPLLRATVNPEGDVNDESGYSPFPGNINQLVLKLSSYAPELERTQGIIAEFVNPKYADASKTQFKSSTRLECMMQDFPKELPSSARVGFTVINQVWAAYSPVKNSPADARAKAAEGNPSHSATTGELDIYEANCRSLQMIGTTVEGPEPRTFNGLDVQFWPRVVWSPAFAATFADLKAKVNGPGVRVGSNASLVIQGRQVEVAKLDVEGALVIKAGPDAIVKVDGLEVRNKGWRWMALNPDKPMTEEQFIRGFKPQTAKPQRSLDEVNIKLIWRGCDSK